ncbi:YHYH protein [Roseibium sediminicola]|uniref:YHYH protein n=1 Tax=Roseibium sediminicola TaxID=2933272 RepID=A0ABT0GXL2_9HYPH|nr:YHYH protein [Roseibium sp. CAU 1639]MCK7614183.1 YHYH protein [Roseibium sp. CAU 1639]
MRLCLALAGALIAFPAAAHDSTLPLGGEEPLEHTHIGEEIWDLLLPSAEASADISVEGSYRRIHADGYPIKPPGKFPNRNNPHSISRKNYNLKVPVKPRKNGRATDAQGSVFGIAINGVVMDPGTAEFWQNNRRSGWNYEALGGACKLGLDRYNAHVQPNGTYHYHGIPTGVLAAEGGNAVPALIGFAADGFPIYGPYGYSDPTGKSAMRKLKSSYRVKQGTRPGGPGGRYNGKFTQDWAFVAGAGDLDQCNGRFAATPEYPDGTYHYVLTDTFPFIPRCWMGSPDKSFMRLKGPGMRGDLDETGSEATVDFATLTDNSDVAVTLVQAQGGHPPRFLPGGRPPPPGAGRGQRRGPPPGGQPPGGGRTGGGPCSGS